METPRWKHCGCVTRVGGPLVVLGPRASVWGLPPAWREQAGTWGASWPSGRVAGQSCAHIHSGPRGTLRQALWRMLVAEEGAQASVWQAGVPVGAS